MPFNCCHYFYIVTEAKRNKNVRRGVSRGIFKSSAGLELKNNPS
jgi:hypothetical protein